MAKLILIHSGLNQEMSKHIIGVFEFANVVVMGFFFQIGGQIKKTVIN